MPALLAMHLSDDSLSLYTDLGVVAAGQASAAVAVKLKNVGDASTPELLAWVEGSMNVRYIIGGTLISATTPQSAISLGILAPNAELDGVIDGTGPLVMSTALLRIIGG